MLHIAVRTIRRQFGRRVVAALLDTKQTQTLVLKPITRLALTLHLTEEHIERTLALDPVEMRRRAWMSDVLLNAYVALRLEERMPTASARVLHRHRQPYVTNKNMALLVRDLQIKNASEHWNGTVLEALLYNASDTTLNAYCKWIESPRKLNLRGA
jgi:hypothetical protein